ncbi:hypothetical protein ACRTAK_003202 [Clostridium perfringens]|nr:hypothetical protein [Clostridium sp.]MDU2680202.1 hypothetical protein [Clostridium sp.]
MFTKNELEWIQELIEDKVSEMIEEGVNLELEFGRVAISLN